MIEKMTKYNWILPSSGKTGFLESLRELGVVDITRSEKAVDKHSEELLQAIEQKKALSASIRKGSDARLLELQACLKDSEDTLASVEPWGQFEKDKLDALGLEVRYYCCPAKKFDASWAETMALEVILEKDGQIWFVTLGSGNLPVKPLSAPSISLVKAQTAVADAQRELDIYKEELEARKAEIPSIEKEISDMESDLSLYLASLTGSEEAEGSISIYTGFAPAGENEKLAAEFDKMPIIWIAQEAEVEDNPPTKLKNGKFSSMFEVITGMYGLPVYGEFDPTPVLAVFFMLFFAMCMGDAGYGLVLILFGIAEEKKWINIEMFSSIGKLIATLGVATLLIGLVMGTAFGVNLTQAEWVPSGLKAIMLPSDAKIAGYPLQMVLALLIGVFHICLAMVIKTVCFIKRFGIKENLSTISWTLLIVGAVIVAALAMFNFLSPDLTRIIVIAIAAVSALGIYIFNKPGRNPLMNIGAGLWDTYNMVTGLLGDVLSYIRLYALGLAGGMLGASFNDIAKLVLGDAANPTWQWIPFVVIILFGHILNLLMSCLGAFVHPLRLTFVEYFKNSGYEGKGIQYNPLKK